MIPHSSLGGQPWGHQMRVPNAERIDSAHMPAEYDSPSVASQPALVSSLPQHQPQSTIIDLTSSGYESHDREPPSKRPRLEISSGAKAGDPSAPASAGDAKSTPISVSSRPQLSWRGRPMWSFQAVVSDLPSSDIRGDHSTGSRPSSPPPFPAHPWNKFPRDSVEDSGPELKRVSPDQKVQTVPYRIETPSIAPALKAESKVIELPNRCPITNSSYKLEVADFTPWTGNHPEDVLNEQTAKQGYYDRTQVSQNESNTARPALYGQLKHRTGLQMLSAVFSAALERRQTHNTVSASSTFKPPPRVTLTDNKREAWLRDLANSSVPLRRLSRTIPHGIRGKVLLDQCLGKWIPVARAVWLAKCVGANEIRAFKRKGTSGALAVGLEAKWVRDWTTNVHQFIEGVFTAPKTSDWKSKMTYTVGLTARLFFENLLDHDHFLEWYLSSLESATLVTTPVWVLMLEIYWGNITRYRRRGRRLAEILLEKLRQAAESKLLPLQPLIDRLSRFIKKLVHEHTSSLILPNSWEFYKSQVTSCLDLSRNVDRALLQILVERNARVQKPPQLTQPTQCSPHQRIIYLLDSMTSACDLTALSSACLDAMEDKATLVFRLLEWAATPFRHGTYRVYVSARLLRKWKVAGIDVDGHLLSFLAQVTRNRNLAIGNVYHIFSELVRSQTFSVGRYLQWLMAKGLTGDPHHPYQSILETPSDVLLITQLPVGRLPQHVRNLRNILLDRTGFSVSDEINMVASVKCLISKRIPKIFTADSKAPISPISLPIDLTWAVKAEIGQWLRQGIGEHTRIATGSTMRAAFPDELVSSVSKLTPDEFYHVRDILETFGDISMLADVLKCASSSNNSTVLASAADTANCYFDCLCVIGATTDLFRKMVDSYANIKQVSRPSLDLIFSLIELGLRIPHELNTVVRLRQDLSRMENKAVLAASSPVSDHVPDFFDDNDPSFREKLDQLLLSGNVMDEPTLDAVFNTLTKHMEHDASKVKLPVNDICRYLAQLRSFQPKYFDGILTRWVNNHLRLPGRPTLLSALPSLIGVGCVTFRSFLSLVRRLNISVPTVSDMADLPADIVKLLVFEEAQSSPLDLVSYRFKLLQQEFLARNCDEVLGIVCDAASVLQSRETNKPDNLEVCLVKLLRQLLVRNPSFHQQSCLKNLVRCSAAIGVLQKALDGLLGFESQQGEKSVISEVEKLASITDDFSLSFGQMKVQLLFHEDFEGSQDRKSITNAIFRTVAADFGAPKPHWVELITLMTPNAVRQIRERAEREFFAIPVMEEETWHDDSSSVVKHRLGTFEAAKLYLTIIEKLADSIPATGASSVTSVLAERMDILLHKIITLDRSLNPSADQQVKSVTRQARSNFERSLAFWFSALLRMVVIHRTSFVQSPSLKTNSSHEQCRLLSTIFCIALSRLPKDTTRLFPEADYFPRSELSGDHQPCPGILLQTHALDVAASLLDVFPDEVRHQCSRFLREKCPPFFSLQNDPRFTYLLGPIGNPTSANIPQTTGAPSPVPSGATPASTSNLPTATHSGQSMVTPSGICAGMDEITNFTPDRFRIQHRGRVTGSYSVRPWELLQDAAPFVGVNDTAVNLGYLEARRVRV
ncbi:Mediator complex subunit Med12 [Penicillium malachiteum]|uniref:Mediator of RNA polymerase II transcription subunit 12 n=1 Tax=Penicillium malachiteum TaxID=1324776 RepID=A0AAD6HUW2_9EURO|nr:Mediator complex subunit Med12 [Penicillium malachiteum]